MPRLKRESSTEKASLEMIGKRLEGYRKFLNRSRESVSKQIGVSPDAILRLEKGRPTLHRTLYKVAAALGLYEGFVSMPNRWQDSHEVHRASEGQWYPVMGRKYRQSRLPVDANDSDERQRLARLGYFAGFSKPLHCNYHCLEKKSAILVELSEAASPVDVEEIWGHPGQEFVYVLRGEMNLRLDEEDIFLEEGDSILFDSNVPHSYGPIKKLGVNEQPPQFLMVVIESHGSEEVFEV